MLDIYLTCDTEVWCNGWNALDAEFPQAFDRYVYGRGDGGEGVGLPFQVKTLNEHGLRGVFFVEPLFSGRFGLAPLQEIVGIVRDGGQEVQLHLHTEWADEARPPLLPSVPEKRQHLRYFDLDQQTALIGTGASLLERAGGGRPRAFRAGSFAFNADTLTALERCGIGIDSSYNATLYGPSSGVSPQRLLTDAVRIGEVDEYPMSVFVDGTGRLRHAQVGACASSELEQAMWSALEQGQRAFVILFHNFELLNRSKTRADAIVKRRFERLCDFLARNTDSFRSRGFADAAPLPAASEPPTLRVGRAATAWRMVEQAARRLTA